MNTSPFQAMGDAGTDSPLAGSAMVVLRGVGDDAAVRRSPKYPAVQPRQAAVDLQRAGDELFMGAPILFAGIGVDGKGIVLGGREQRTVDLDQSGLKRRLFTGVEAAEHFEPRRILGVDGIEGGIALGRESVVVVGPILVSGLRQSGTTEQARGRENGEFPLHNVPDCQELRQYSLLLGLRPVGSGADACRRPPARGLG
jgi:hypothetical protein